MKYIVFVTLILFTLRESDENPIFIGHTYRFSNGKIAVYVTFYDKGIASISIVGRIVPSGFQCNWAQKKNRREITLTPKETGFLVDPEIIIKKKFSWIYHIPSNLRFSKDYQKFKMNGVWYCKTSSSD